MGFKAINERAQSQSTPAGESYEAKESRVVQDYEAALRLLAIGDKHQAMAAFENLLECELLVAATNPRSKPTETIQQVRFLVLKNQAEMLADADDTAQDALQLYLVALDQTRNDPVLWHHAGSLAAELAEWGVARHALEQSLKCSPSNVLVAEKLLEVLLQIGDLEAAGEICRHLLRVHPGHPRASQLSACIARPGIANAAELTDTEAEASELQPKFPKLLRSLNQPPAAEDATVLDVPEASWPALLQALASYIEQGLLSKNVNSRLNFTIGGKALDEVRQELEASGNGVASPEAMEVDNDTAEQAAPPDAAVPESGAVQDEVAAGGPVASSADGMETAAVVTAQPQEAAEAPPAGHQAVEAAAEPAGAQNPAKQPRPQRASKRLVARKAKGEEGEAGGSGSEGQRNVITTLSSFLGSRPPAAAQLPPSQGEPPPEATLPPPAEAQAVAAVLRLLERHRESGSIPELVAAAIVALTDAPPERRLPAGALEALLQLDLLVGGWERPQDSALMLAELHLDKAVGVASKAKPRGGSAVKAAAEDTATVRRHMQAARSNLGQYALRASDQQARVPAKIVQRRQVRQLWAQARCWEQTGRDSEAAAAFDACLALCRGGSLESSPPWSPDLPEALSPSAANGGGAGTDVGVEVVLANCTRDNVISTAAVEPRIANTQLLALAAAASVSLREGRHAEAVASLAPKCLGSAAGIDRACHVRALGLLKDALAGVEGEQYLGVELVARLMHVARKLRRVPDDIDDSSLHTAPSASRQPPRGVDVARALRPTGNPGGKPQSLLNLAAAADKIAKLKTGSWQWRPDAVPGLELEPLESVRLQELVREAQWKLLASAERAYWAIPPGRKSSHPDLDKMNREVMVASLAAIASLQQLEESTPLDAGSLLDVLGSCMQLAEERRAVAALNHALPRSCLTSLSRCLDLMKAGSTEDMGEDEEEEVERLQAARAQCLYLIFGVDFEERDAEWGSSTKEQQEEEQQLALKSQADCMELWPFLCDYAAAAEDAEQLGSLKGVFKRVAEFYPPTPEAELDQDPTLRLLDGPDPDQGQLLACSDATSILPPASTQAPEGDVRAKLYSFQLQIEAAELREGREVDSDALEAILTLARADLHFNPRSHTTWDALAGCYRHAHATLLEESPPVDEDAKQREQLLRRRALRATAIVRLVLPKGDKRGTGRCEQELGLLLLAEARSLKQQGNTTAFRWHCEQAAAAFERAAAALPEEWQSEYQLGKSKAKLGAPAGVVLRHYARACWLASTLLGGRVEPLYRLHASRLKLLLQGGAGDVDAVEKFCFLDSTADRLRQLRSGSPPPIDGDEQPAAKRPRLEAGGPADHQILVDDCVAALRFCLEWSKGFHKARYTLARAADSAGEGPAAAAEELRPLFPRSSGSGKKPFSIAVDAIKDPDAREYGAGRHGERLEAAPAVDAADESLWGRKPGRVAGVGLQEGTRKHAAALRKYLAYYLRLLARIRDVPRLQAAVYCLRLPSTSTQHPGLADLINAASGMLITVLASQASSLIAEAFVPHPVAEISDGWRMRRELTEAEAATLESAFQVYAEHSSLLDGSKAGKWGECYNGALAACADLQGCLPTAPPGSMNEASFGRYARGYIAHLGKRQDAERLWAIASKALRRLKQIPAADRVGGGVPDAQTAAVLAAACSASMASCLARLEQACAERGRVQAEREKASEECEPTMEAPQEVAQQADNPEASSAEAAAAAAGMPSESAATTQGGSPLKRKAEAAKQVGQSPAATLKPRRTEPATPESPLRALAVKGYRALRLLYGLHRACRQLIPAADSQEQQADRDAMLVRAVVAYTHMMHGEEVRVAPLGIRDAEAIAAELGRQAGKSGGAPLPNLAGRTVTDGGSQLRESPVARPRAAPPQAAAAEAAVPPVQSLEPQPAQQAAPQLQTMGSAAGAADAGQQQVPQDSATGAPAQQPRGVGAEQLQPAASPARGDGLFTAGPQSAGEPERSPRTAVGRQQTDWLLSQLAGARRGPQLATGLASAVPRAFLPPGDASRES